MNQLVTSDFKLGVIAGGQLGKMLAAAAGTWDVKTYVLDPDRECPASDSCTQVVQGDPRNFEDVLKFGRMVDMITFEIEDVNIEALKLLNAEEKRIFPEPHILEIIRDKGLQKAFYEQHGIPSSGFQLFDSREEILEALRSGSLDLPFVQKLRVGGYDGRGVAVIDHADKLDRLLEGSSMVEQKVEIRHEISVIAARNLSGQTTCFPAVEMQFNHEAHLVEQLICPAAIPEEEALEAAKIATSLINAFGMTGLLAVEMFIDKNGKTWVNEAAPRPHNSGHHTIESIVTSQYEQLLRAIFDMPLGSTALKMPAVMINLLGRPGYEGAVCYEGLTECMGMEGVKLHLYGKKVTRPFRKMGHATVLDSCPQEAWHKAGQVKNTIKVKSWDNLQ